MKKIVLAIIAVLMSSQLMAQDTEPSKLEYRNLQLKLENAELRLEVDSLQEALVESQVEIDTLSAQLMSAEIKLVMYSVLQDMLDSLNNAPPEESMIQEDGSYYVTEDRALEFIKDDYEFYNRNKKYREVKLRRKESNVFWVSLEEADKRYASLGWSAKVKTLTVNEDGTFTFN